MTVDTMEMDPLESMPEPVGDPDAPYGRSPTGAPYKLPPEQRAILGERLAAGRATRGTTAPSRRKRTTKTPPRRSAPNTTAGEKAGLAMSRADSARMAMLVPIALCGIAAKITGRASFIADAVALEANRDGIAEGAALAAESYPAVATLIDKLTMFGPWMPLAHAVLQTGAQIAANHGVKAAIGQYGAVSPEQLLAGAERQAASLIAEQQAMAAEMAGSGGILT